MTSRGGDTGPPVTATRIGWPSLPMLISKLAATCSMVSAMFSLVHSSSSASLSLAAFSGSRMTGRRFFLAAFGSITSKSS